MSQDKAAMSAITPYLCCSNAAVAIDFYKAALGAEEVMRLAEPGGRVGHAELRIGGALVMLSDEYPEMGISSPQTLGGSPVSIALLVPDVDALIAKAAAAGATVTRAAADQFYGHRSGTFTDPAGHRWHVSTVKEDLSNAEIQRRFDAMMAKSG
jgi:PhnB protein